MRSWKQPSGMWRGARWGAKVLPIALQSSQSLSWNICLLLQKCRQVIGHETENLHGFWRLVFCSERQSFPRSPFPRKKSSWTTWNRMSHWGFRCPNRTHKRKGAAGRCHAAAVRRMGESVHSMQPSTFLKEQIHRTGRCQDDPLAWETPLIGRVDNPFEFVGKEAVVAALRQDLSMLQSSEYIPTHFDVSLVSGHTFRRSGAQQLALEGVPLDLIQYLARHSSQAIAAYVEDAVERCPTAASKLMEHLSLQEQIAKLVEKVSTVEELQNRTAAALATMASSDNSPSFNEAKARTLIESYLKPGVVLNVGTLKIHSTAGNSFLQSPTDWTTSCGWNWVRAGRLTRVVASADDIPEEATRCAKCRDMFPDWVPWKIGHWLRNLINK